MQELPHQHLSKPLGGRFLSSQWDGVFGEYFKVPDVDLNVADDAYKCRFTAIHLEDSSRYYCDFSLRVVTPYDKGLMVLSEQEGKAMLSFLADNEEGDNFDKWVYYKENGDYLEGAPLSLEQPDYAYNSELFVTTSEGVYRLDKNILKILDKDN